MDQREAKRMVCRELADMLLLEAHGGLLGLPATGEDARRVELALLELSQEMARRGRLPALDPLPGQMSIEDVETSMV